MDFSFLSVVVLKGKKRKKKKNKKKRVCTRVNKGAQATNLPQTIKAGVITNLASSLKI